MKRLLVIALFFLVGCVSSDPTQNMVNETKLLGTWTAVILGSGENTYTPKKKIQIMFTADGEFLQNTVAGVTGSYLVDGNRVKIVAMDKKDTIIVSARFKLKNNTLLLSDFRANETAKDLWGDSEFIKAGIKTVVFAAGGG